jgi:hypothetical protein
VVTYINSRPQVHNNTRRRSTKLVWTNKIALLCLLGCSWVMTRTTISHTKITSNLANLFYRSHLQTKSLSSSISAHRTSFYIIYMVGKEEGYKLFQKRPYKPAVHSLSFFYLKLGPVISNEMQCIITNVSLRDCLICHKICIPSISSSGSSAYFSMNTDDQ